MTSSHGASPSSTTISDILISRGESRLGFGLINETCGMDNFVQALKGEKAEDAEKRRMIDLLMRVEEQRRADEMDNGSDEEESCNDVVEGIGQHFIDKSGRGRLREVDQVSNLAEKFAGFDLGMSPYLHVRGRILPTSGFLDVLDNAHPSVLWDRLTDTERDEFIRTITQTPHLVQPALQEFFLDLWKPWWEPVSGEQPRRTGRPKPVVEILGDPRDGRGDEHPEAAHDELATPYFNPAVAPRPTVSRSIVPLSNLSAKPPSPSAIFNLPDLLISYSHCMRALNGDLYEDVWESVGIVLDASAVLVESPRSQALRKGLDFPADGSSGQSVHPPTGAPSATSLQESLALTRHRFQPPPAEDYWLLLLRDVLYLLSSYDDTLSALSDLHELMGAASALAQDEGGRSPSPGGSPVPGVASGGGVAMGSARSRALRPFKRRAFVAEKKVLWYACYVEGMREEWEGVFGSGRNVEGAGVPNPLEVLRKGVEMQKDKLANEVEEFAKQKREMEARIAQRRKALKEGGESGRLLVQEL
ncbi:hypothetical protein HDU93_000537 [Gonapodya sp. JEL0774]|nr:hypothetical protein HDU93_000537 [Gonapodya sp. JEL0774]